MKTVNSNEFRCPSGDFTSTTAKRVFNHMASDKCRDSEIYVNLKQTHDAAIEHLAKKAPVPSDVISGDNKVRR